MGPEHHSPNWLAHLLGISRGILESLAKSHGSHYHPFQRPKRDGGQRDIDNPDNAIKAVQRRIVDRLLKPLPFPECVQGCLPGRSAKTNAEHHLKQTSLVTIDIASFFPSVSNRHVYSAWDALGLGPEIARLLTHLTTYHGHLPQGAPTSPYLANLVVLKADAGIQKAASKLGVHYTRHVDDVALSGENAREVMGEAIRQIQALGFAVKRRMNRTGNLGGRVV